MQLFSDIHFGGVLKFYKREYKDYNFLNVKKQRLSHVLINTIMYICDFKLKRSWLHFKGQLF